MKQSPRPSSSACDSCRAGYPVSTGTTTQISGVSRRDFIVKGSVALAITALWGCDASLTDPLKSPLTVTVADYPALATVGTAVKVWAGPKTPVGIIQSSLGDYEAFSLTCPHQGSIVSAGSGSIPFACSGHGAQFNANGQWVGGQPTGNLTRYNVSFDATAGTLTVQP